MMKLMNTFWELNQKAIAENKYFAAMSYSTAEDLTDALFKGISTAEGFDRAIPAFIQNEKLASNAEEKEAWANILEIVASTKKELGL